MALGDVTHHNLKQLRKINQVVFPVSYNDKFYKDVLEAGELVKLVYFNDIVVGGVCCRIDASTNGKRRMYIMTLGCLAPYRRIGLGTLMLDHVFSLCDKDATIESIFLHVQISNDSAIEFYRKFGFEIVETTENYYKRIEPTDAYVLEKSLKKSTMENSAAGAKNSQPFSSSKTIGSEFEAADPIAISNLENLKNDSKKKNSANSKKKQQKDETETKTEPKAAADPEVNGDVDETGSFSSSTGGSDKENSDPKD